MTGSLPSDVVLSPQLSDLALSYNQFTGTIPLRLVANEFSSLDLSFNKLTGTLPPSNSTVPSSGAVYLNVNRLSGAIPAVLKLVSKISILDGNIFECNFYRDTLPVHDPQHAYYECCTSALQWATYAWVTLFALGAALLLCLLLLPALLRNATVVSKVMQWLSSINAARRRWMSHTTQALSVANGHLLSFGSFLASLRASFFWLCLYVLLVLLPLYVGASHAYSMYQQKYAWSVSSVYLSGQTPAMLLLAFLVLLLVWMFGVFYFHLRGFVPDEEELRVESVDAASKAPSERLYYTNYLCLAGVALFNFVIILAINVGYVIITTRFSPTVVIIAQLVLGTFKLLWNDLVIRGTTAAARAYAAAWVTAKRGSPPRAWEERSLDGLYLSFNTATMILNIIFIPCMATAFVSSDCFYDIIIPPSPIDSSYSYTTCAAAQTIFDLRFANCTSRLEVTTTTSYLPPFLYRYQCSSALITTYAELYVYKYIVAAFGQPLLALAMDQARRRMDPRGALFARLHGLLPLSFFSTDLLRGRRETLFFKDRLNLRVITYTSVFVTFGVIFPPLAVMICLAVVVQSLLAQLRIGFVLDEVSSDPEVLQDLTRLLNSDCRNAGDIFKHSVVVVGPVAALFFAFIIFDTYGDQVGASAAVWAAAVMFTLGCLLTLAFRHLVRGGGGGKQDSRDTSNQDKPSAVDIELTATKASNPLQVKETDSDSDAC